MSGKERKMCQWKFTDKLADHFTLLEILNASKILLAFNICGVNIKLIG